jgi:hypothetical protein
MTYKESKGMRNTQAYELGFGRKKPLGKEEGRPNGFGAVPVPDSKHRHLSNKAHSLKVHKG